MTTYRVIGLMSGSSLDGLDIALCEFTFNGAWKFKILDTAVAPYTDEWLQEIKHLPVATAKSFVEVHAAMGSYFGMLVADFIEQKGLTGKVGFVASHGHTVFHFPEKGFTTQLGDGAALAAKVGLPVVCNFRTADVANGGQGTPIVPIGDLLLFSSYRFCLNIGGITNISCKAPRGIVAFDIAPANQVLNVFAQKAGKEYDEGGMLAASGKVNHALLQQLNGLEYYAWSYPKSLDNSYSREMLLPLIEQAGIPLEDRLCTCTEHIAMQVAAHIKTITEREGITITSADAILATGGGAFNTYLVDRIRHYAQISVVVPEAALVKFKEALVIAFMGVLRMRGEVNVLKTVTGALHDTVGGAVYL